MDTTTTIPPAQHTQTTEGQPNFTDSAGRDPSGFISSHIPGSNYKTFYITRTRPERMVKITLGKSDVVVKRTTLNRQSKPSEVSGERSKRGRVTEYTRHTARRLKMALREHRDMLKHEICLTYPNEFPTDMEIVKGHWTLMRKWLVDQGIQGIWILEFDTTRGAPHFHLLTTTDAVHRRSLSYRWAKIVDSGDPNHEQAGTSVRRIDNVDAAINYYHDAKKPQKRVPEGVVNVGKFWGVFGGLKSVKKDLVLTEEQAAPLVRSLRGLDRSHRRSMLEERPFLKDVVRNRKYSFGERDNGMYGYTLYDVGPEARRMMERLAPELMTDKADHIEPVEQGATAPPRRLAIDIVTTTLAERRAKWELEAAQLVQ